MTKVEMLNTTVDVLQNEATAKKLAPPASKKRRKWLAPVIALVLAASAASGGYVWYTHKPAAAATATIRAHRGSLTETSAASGKIEPTTQVEVKSKASGAVAEVLVKEGDHVESGQLLVRLDKADAQRKVDSAKLSLARTKADLTSSQASVNVAQLDLKNNQEAQSVADRGVELGVGSAEAARNATHTTQVSTANVTLKQAQLQSTQLSLQAAELAVQDAQTELANTDVYAPMAGTVLTLGVEKGTIVASALTSVSGGTSVLTLADLSDLRIVGAINEAQVAKVNAGQAVDIRVDAYPNRTFKGVVDRVSPLGTETSNVVTFDVEIKIVDENESLLRSGMSADVEIVTHEEKDVILVPLTAVQAKGNRRFVSLASGEERAIETGATDGSQMVVTKGLTDGEMIRPPAPAAESTAKPSTQKSQNPMGGGMGMGSPRGGR